MADEQKQAVHDVSRWQVLSKYSTRMWDLLEEIYFSADDSELEDLRDEILVDFSNANVIPCQDPEGPDF